MDCGCWSGWWTAASSRREVCNPYQGWCSKPAGRAWLGFRIAASALNCFLCSCRSKTKTIEDFGLGWYFPMKNGCQQIAWVAFVADVNSLQTLVIFTIVFGIFSIMHSLILFWMLALQVQAHSLIGNSLELIWLGFVGHSPTAATSSCQGCFAKRASDLGSHFYQNRLHRRT